MIFFPQFQYFCTKVVQIFVYQLTSTKSNIRPYFCLTTNSLGIQTNPPPPPRPLILLSPGAQPAVFLPPLPLDCLTGTWTNSLWKKGTSQDCDNSENWWSWMRHEKTTSEETGPGQWNMRESQVRGFSGKKRQHVLSCVGGDYWTAISELRVVRREWNEMLNMLLTRYVEVLWL